VRGPVRLQNGAVVLGDVIVRVDGQARVRLRVRLRLRLGLGLGLGLGLA